MAYLRRWRGESTGYHRPMATEQPEKLPFTGDDEADRLLAEDPLALLIGFVLDQQVPLQKAFSTRVASSNRDARRGPDCRDGAHRA